MSSPSKVKEKLTSLIKGKGKANDASKDVPQDLDAIDVKFCDKEHPKAKEKGTFAKHGIKKGTRIIKEKPALSVGDAGDPHAVYWHFLHLNSEDLKRQILSLSYRSDVKIQKEREVHGNVSSILGLCRGYKGSVKTLGHASIEQAAIVLAILNDNQVRLQRGTRADISVQIAKINHSCCPNVAVSWNEACRCYVVHALRDIAKGEEILYSYVYLPEPKKDRQEQLQRWGIDCNCGLCDCEILSLEAQRQNLSEKDKKERPGLNRRDTGQLNAHLWWETDGPQGCENRRQQWKTSHMSTNKSQEMLYVDRPPGPEYYHEMLRMLQPEAAYLVEERANLYWKLAGEYARGHEEGRDEQMECAEASRTAISLAKVCWGADNQTTKKWTAVVLDGPTEFQEMVWPKQLN